MTPEQQEAAIERMFADPMTAEVCPECGGRIEDRRKVGRSLYLLPCGHRAGQIDAEGKLLAATFSRKTR